MESTVFHPARCRRYLCLLWLALCLCTVAGTPAHADHPVPATIKDYWHASWRQHDGAPPSIWGIAQTQDGWLWLATPSGLYRFDGVNFEAFDLLPPDNPGSRAVAGLFVAGNGDLWAAYSGGGMAVRHPDGRQGCCRPEGLPEGVPVDDMTDLPSGAMLAIAGGRFYVLDHERWSPREASAIGLDAEALYGFGSLDGEPWAATRHGLYAWAPDKARFVAVDERPLEESQLLGSPRGDLWIYTAGEGFSLVRRAASPAAPATSGRVGSSMFIDRDDGLWSVICGHPTAVCRLKGALARHMPIAWRLLHADEFRPEDGFPATGAMTGFEDRKGNVWFGTKWGLERFTPRAFTQVRFPRLGLYFALVPEADGTVWAGTAMNTNVEDHWWRIGQGDPTPREGFAHAVTAAYRDQDGSVLLGSEDGLWRFDGRSFDALAPPAAAKGVKLQAMIRDRQGRLWASFRGQPVYAQIDGAWLGKGGVTSLPDQPPAIAGMDPQGRIWFGYFSNLLTVLDHDRMTAYGAAQGLDLGTTTALVTTPPVLVGGEHGLAVFDGRAFRRLRATRDDAFTGITGMLRTDDGTLWINGNAGAVRVKRADLRRAIDDADFKLPVSIFDDEDGVAGGAQQVRPLPTLVQGRDGRLWFAGASGLAWIDPGTLGVSPRPPALLIRSIQAAGKTYDPALANHLPPSTRDLTIHYSALETVSAKRQAFRYKLEGLGQDWQDAGSRRVAIYSNLGPGHYTFHLQGASEDGAWNTEGARVDFDIQPFFYETWWFKAAATAALLLLAWLAYVARLGFLKRDIRERLTARHAERERIARDLHDTLLQGVQGLLLRLQSWSSSPKLDDDQRREMDRFVNNARDIMVEGRDRILHLRCRSDEHATLEELLNDAIAECAGQTGARLSLSVHGSARPMPRDLLFDVADIAREAIRNATRHAQAGSIEVSVRYGSRSLTVTVRDDGCGIGQEVLRAGGRPGHWGLRGMKERARRISSSLAIDTSASGGTRIELSVPARLAYETD